jgi:tight adherence protein B
VNVGLIALMLVASLTVLLLGIWYAHQGWEQRAETLRRSRLERGDPVSRRLQARVDALLRRTAAGRALEARLAAAGIEIGVTDFLLLTVAAAVLAYVLGNLLAGRVIGLLALAGALFGAARYVAFRRARRRDQFVAQLPELARVMSNAAAAGLALPRSIEIAANELDHPATDIMRRVVDELRLGQSVERALENLEGRLPSREVSVLVSTLVIQQRAGGDTVQALRDMSQTLEARKDLRREVRTVMAGPIATGWIVAALGIATLVLINLIDPGSLEAMTQSPIGIAALAVGSVLYAIGFLLVRRITRIET